MSGTVENQPEKIATSTNIQSKSEIRLMGWLLSSVSHFFSLQRVNFRGIGNSKKVFQCSTKGLDTADAISGKDSPQHPAGSSGRVSRKQKSGRSRASVRDGAVERPKRAGKARIGPASPARPGSGGLGLAGSAALPAPKGGSDKGGSAATQPGPADLTARGVARAVFGPLLVVALVVVTVVLRSLTIG